MRSTTQFLATRFEPGKDDNQSRALRLSKEPDANPRPPIEMPEIYLDYIHFIAMTNPVNIKLSTHTPDVFIDLAIKLSLKLHPLSNLPFAPCSVDQDLKARIDAWLTIEELKVYIRESEERRFLIALSDKTDHDFARLPPMLPFKTADMIAAYRYRSRHVPDHFYSHAPGKQIMTLAVRLDRKHNMDFQEFLSCQPAVAGITEEELSRRTLLLMQHKERRRKDILAEQEKELGVADALHSEAIKTAKETSTTPPNAASFKQRKEKIKAIFTSKLNGIDNLSMDNLFETEMTEYINPCTGEVLRSIEINYELIQEIDDFLNPMLRQFNDIKKWVSKKIASGEPLVNDIFTKKAVPPDKIPESLQVGQIPGEKEKLEVKTHPVKIDGKYLIDFNRLQSFWEPGWPQRLWKSHSFGINPFTGQKVETLEYDHELKAATYNFVLNIDLFLKTLTPKNITDGGFLRRSGTNSHRVFQAGIVHRHQLFVPKPIPAPSVASEPEPEKVEQASIIHK